MVQLPHRGRITILSDVRKGVKSTSMAYQKAGLKPLFHLLFALLSLQHIVAELACPQVFAVIQVRGYRPGVILAFGRTVRIAGERQDWEWFGALGDFAGRLEGVRKMGRERRSRRTRRCPGGL